MINYAVIYSSLYFINTVKFVIKVTTITLKFDKKKFIRLVLVNGENTDKHIIKFFSVLEEFAAENSSLIKKR